MRIGIYPASLHVCGGGEKYIGKVAEILSKTNDVSFIVFEEPDFPKLQSRLTLDLRRVAVHQVRRPPLLNAARHMFLGWLVDFCDAYQVSKSTRKYDLFINQEHASFIRSHAERSILICEVPPVRRTLRDNPLTRWLFDPKSKAYEALVVNSRYTRRWAEQYYRRKALLLHPPVDTQFFTPSVKRKIILSVGRFSTALHCKKQLDMVKAFKQLCADPQSSGWEYHLAGGVGSQEYLEDCKKEAAGYPVKFHPDASFDMLRELYGKARIFWHATGLGENERVHPERMEHFGITTVEAMSAGCVPVVINRGGQPEIVEHNVTGFLFDTPDELVSHTATLMKDDALWQKMSLACMERSQRFGMDVFENRVRGIFESQDSLGPR